MLRTQQLRLELTLIATKVYTAAAYLVGVEESLSLLRCLVVQKLLVPAAAGANLILQLADLQAGELVRLA